MIEIDFWYDFASTYSYPSAMRIETLAQALGIGVCWKPFLLGPIFADQGWRNSPFNLYPVKGRYMWRDLQRICTKADLPLIRPDPFPQNSLLAARAAIAVGEERCGEFSKAVYHAEFAKGQPISDRECLAGILSSLGFHPAEIIERAASESVKTKLKQNTDEARRIGIFGAPSFCTREGELFWGNDRLEEALDWALHGH